MGMEKSVKRKIEYAFFNYKKNMATGVISTVDWAESNMGVDYSKICVQSSNVNSKETKLCEIIDDGITAYRWCLVVEKVLDYYKWDVKERFIRQRYFDKKSMYQICLNIGICERTFKYWKDEILHKAQQWAEEMRLI